MKSSMLRVRLLAGQNDAATTPIGRWLSALRPRPYSVVATVVYLMVYGALVLENKVAPGGERGITVALALWASWLLDRLAPRSRENATSRWTGVALLLVQFGLIEVVASIDAGPRAFLHCLLVYRAGWHFGAYGVYVVAGLAWSIAFWEHGLPVIRGPRWLTLGNDVSSLAFATFLLLLVVGIVRAQIAERASRIRADRLVQQLQSAHAQLRLAANHALAVVAERNELAREIHEQLGQALTAIHVQLEKARRFRSLDAAAAEQAIHDAKALGSTALQDVRRSVRMLRAPRADALTDGSTALPVLDAAQSPGSPAHRFDLASSALYLAIFAMYAGWSVQEFRFWSATTYSLLALMLSLVALDRADPWLLRRFPGQLVAAGLLTLRILGVVAVSGLLGLWYSSWLLLMLPYYGFVYFGSRFGYYFSVSAWFGLCAIAIAIAIADGGKYLTGFVAGLIAYTLIQLLIMSTSKTILDERRHREQAEEMLAELQSAHAALRSYAAQALAARTERVHLAREIHDGLGHYLTVINVQLEKAIAFRTVDARTADSAAQTALQLVDEALHEVRGSTQAIGRADERFSLLTALEHMIRHLGSNPQIDLWTAGSEQGCSQQSLLVLYRIAQEGLTNVQKHADASHVRLTLCFEEHAASITIEDNGRGFTPRHDLPRQDGCYGLQGARERVEQLGGTFELRATPGRGTQLQARVPRVAPIHQACASAEPQEQPS